MAKVGRPTKLTPELLDKAKAYVNGGYLKDELVPTIAGLSLCIDIRRSTVYEWSKENQEFSDIVEKVLAAQEHGLIKGALAGDYNSTIAKLMLTKHGYSDKQETELSGPGGNPIQIQEVKLTIVDPQH